MEINFEIYDGRPVVTVTGLSAKVLSAYLREHICPHTPKSTFPRTSNPFWMAKAIQKRIEDDDFISRHFVSIEKKSIRYQTCSGIELFASLSSDGNWQMVIEPTSTNELVDVLWTFAYVLPELKHVSYDVFRACIVGFLAQSQEDCLLTLPTRNFNTKFQ